MLKTFIFLIFDGIVLPIIVFVLNYPLSIVFSIFSKLSSSRQTSSTLESVYYLCSIYIWGILCYGYFISFPIFGFSHWLIKIIAIISLGGLWKILHNTAQQYKDGTDRFTYPVISMETSALLPFLFILFWIWSSLPSYLYFDVVGQKINDLCNWALAFA